MRSGPVGSAHSLNIDVRIIAATNRDMLNAVREGRFREDLFYRINTFTIHLPPLRHRGEDLPLLVDYFLRRACARINKRVDHVSPEAIALLRQYHWPGNLREMQNVIETAVIMAGSGLIEPENIFFPHDDRTGHREAGLSFMDEKAAVIEDFEQKTLKRYLADANGNISTAAKLAGVPRRTFHRLMEKYDINSGRGCG
ncbi:MAG: sigma 54-interacting transcriptional regulator [Acidobacteriota bacterium]